ncbi:MAG TPA: DUF4358 domain-containing protein [Firmicutes bacterium]|nr:DUF4358 domain-containing protein [Bacillota bacterium]
MLDVAACAESLREEVPFSDDLEVLSDKMVDVLYRLEEGDVVRQKVYVSSGATAEEIAVFEAAGPEAAGRVKAAVDARLAEQQAAFADYLPAEVPKLADPYLQVAGRYVILCVSGHNDVARQVVAAQLKR